MPTRLKEGTQLAWFEPQLTPAPEIWPNSKAEPLFCQVGAFEHSVFLFVFFLLDGRATEEGRGMTGRISEKNKLTGKGVVQ